MNDKIKVSIRRYIKLTSDRIFLYFNKDYEDMNSIEGKKRIKAAIREYYDVPIIRLAYQLIYFDSKFLHETISRNIYTLEEINMAIGLANYCKETVKVR